MVDQVEEVKQKTDIVSLISDYVDLKKAGSNYKALCPFHSEKTSSFMVSPELQIYKCFGCGESGDAYSFLQKYEGMDFPEALKFLADRVGIKLKKTKGGQGQERQKLYDIGNFTAKFYHYILTKHAAGRPALAYLTKQRGLKPNSIKTFQLGYSPDSPGAIQKFLVGKKGYKERDLQEAGLLYTRGRNSFDRFRGRVVFPLFDHRGNVTGFSGRLLPGKEKPNLAKYINSPETPAYHKSKQFYALNIARDSIKKDREAIVVEGELDVISSWQAGIKNAIAIKGSALTQDQALLLRRFADRIILALDEDLAGDKAARRGLEIAENAGLEVKIARLGKYKDPDDFARRDPQGFKKTIDKAVGVWDFVVDSIFSKYDAKTGVGKSRISKEIVPALSSISDSIVKAHYAELVAKRLGVPTESVINQITTVKAETVSQKPSLEIPTKFTAKSRQELLEERLMSLAFQSDPKILIKREIQRLISTPLAKRILVKYRDYHKTSKTFDPSEFAETLPKELVDGFAEMILKGTLEDVASKEERKKEVELIIYELKVLSVKDKLGDLAGQIRDYEENNQMGKLKKAKIKFSKISQDLSELEQLQKQSIILSKGA